MSQTAMENKSKYSSLSHQIILTHHQPFTSQNAHYCHLATSITPYRLDNPLWLRENHHCMLYTPMWVIIFLRLSRTTLPVWKASGRRRVSVVYQTSLRIQHISYWLKKNICNGNCNTIRIIKKWKQIRGPRESSYS